MAPDALQRLASLSDTSALRPAESRVGRVDQRARCHVVDGVDRHHSGLGDFARAFGQLVRQRASPSLGGVAYAPNEATVMAYDGPGDGIGAHLDRRRYRVLIGIFSVSGSAVLEVVGDRAGETVLARFACEPGDLVLLRAPGLGGVTDGRPLHRVFGPSVGRRVSLTLRMDAAAPGDTVSNLPAHIAAAECRGKL